MAGRRIGIISGVPNLPPVAEAGADGEVDNASDYFLYSTGSTDPDGFITDYAWSQVGGTTVCYNEKFIRVEVRVVGNRPGQRIQYSKYN